MFGNQFFLIDILFDGKQYLLWVYRFYKVIGHLRANGFVHDSFFFAFGNHYHRNNVVDLLNTRQRFEPSIARHIFIEENNVELIFTNKVDGIAAIGCCVYFIVLVFEENNVRLKQVNFVIDP